jgi:hypothetical protein
MENMSLTDRERALIMLTRSVRNGTIDRIGVVDGEPAVVISITQRVDLQRPDELAAVLGNGFTVVNCQKNSG